jgi:hypothetical protein
VEFQLRYSAIPFAISSSQQIGIASRAPRLAQEWLPCAGIM